MKVSSLFALSALVALCGGTRSVRGPWDMKRREEIASLAAQRGEVKALFGRSFLNMNARAEAGLPSPPPPPPDPQYSTFQQKVDHFNSSSGFFAMHTATFRPKNPGPNSPVFVFLGGEGPLEIFLEEVYMKDLASQHDAYLIFLEHRFYGMTNPTGDLTTQSLELLTSDQALADVHYFIETTKNSVFRGHPFMTFGCSYSGMLSGWYNGQYGDDVAGSFGPSGPYLAKLNYTGYLEQFSSTAGPNCAAVVAKASQLVLQAAQSASNQVFASAFGSCAPTVAASDLPYALWTIAETIGGLAQEDLPPNWPVYQVCNQFESAALGNQDMVAAFGKIFQSLSGGGCTDFTEKSMIASMTNTTVLGNYDGARAWMWQTCKEFGYFQTGYEGTSVFFPFPSVEKLVSYCEAIFGIKGMTPDVDGTNARRGGLNPVGVKNLMVTNGLLDPWHLLSIDSPSSNITVAMYTAGHCAPLHANTTQDPPSLLQAREAIADWVSESLAKYSRT